MSSDSTRTIASSAEFVPANCFAPLDFEEIFGCPAPVELHLGCGDGSFLAAIAAANPDTNFLGVERLVGRVRTTCRRIERAGLANARVLRLEISYVVEHLLAEGSVTAFHLLFPDPWPKRRHAPRRLVSEQFLRSLDRALIEQGSVHIATDDTEYFRQISALISRTSMFAISSDEAAEKPTTKFERRFLQDGIPIHRLSLRKISPVT